MWWRLKSKLAYNYYLWIHIMTQWNYLLLCVSAEEPSRRLQNKTSSLGKFFPPWHLLSSKFATDKTGESIPGCFQKTYKWKSLSAHVLKYLFYTLLYVIRTSVPELAVIRTYDMPGGDKIIYKVRLRAFMYRNSLVVFCVCLPKFSIARIPWLVLLAPFKNSCARLLLCLKCLNCVLFSGKPKWKVSTGNIYIARNRARCAFKFPFLLVKNNVFILERSKTMTCQNIQVFGTF